ncbi:hypothetical protein ACQUSR_23280 [Streptomyces sp. P1-3]|uniref:hypothetical protein n=1 Tax=Streptomyces sp. P1-3 TaxID=3421658 RepID=UPI003D359B28
MAVATTAVAALVLTACAGESSPDTADRPGTTTASPSPAVSSPAVVIPSSRFTFHGTIGPGDVAEGESCDFEGGIHVDHDKAVTYVCENGRWTFLINGDGRSGPPASPHVPPTPG